MVLTDFGIARSAAATGLGKGETGADAGADAAEAAPLPISGTPEYMSPEQARGQRCRRTE